MNDRTEKTACPNSIIDWSRSAVLDTHSAVVSVNEDGSTALWLISRTPSRDYGCACPQCAPHEQPVRLPADMRDRLHLICGRRTSAGHPCRTSVKRAGSACQWHRGQERLP